MLCDGQYEILGIHLPPQHETQTSRGLLGLKPKSACPDSNIRWIVCTDIHVPQRMNMLPQAHNICVFHVE